MTIDWFHFSFALLLLWLPRPVLRFGAQIFRRRRRSRNFKDTNPATTRQPGEMRVGFKNEFGKFRNYVDFLRGGIGTIALAGGLPGFAPAFGAGDDLPVLTVRLIWGATILILLIGLLIQSFRFEARVTLFAPIFYLAGMSVGMCGPVVAIFALLLVWTINLALPNPGSFLSVYALLMVAFAALFRGFDSDRPYVMAGLCFLPVFLSLLIRRPLVLFSKKTKLAGSAA